MKTRRDFLKTSAVLGAGAATCAAASAQRSPFKISLAQWSMHRAIMAGDLDNLDLVKLTRDKFGIDAVEYSNRFFSVGDRYKDKLGFQPKPQSYLAEMKKRAADVGVSNLLIMCDGVGKLGDPDPERRKNAVEGHFAWCDAAKFLGCHSIRVNARSQDSLQAGEQKRLCVDGLRRLSEHAAPMGLSVIVENHGGLSSDGAWLADVMKTVGYYNCGTLPDFGNFYLVKNRGKKEQYEKAKALFSGRKTQENEFGLEYDRYQGMRDLMPFAKGVSAKSHDFDKAGNEIHTDYTRVMKIVKDSGYAGYIGIEYEGSNLSELEGIGKTKRLLERVFQSLA